MLLAADVHFDERAQVDFIVEIGRQLCELARQGIDAHVGTSFRLRPRA